MGQAVATGQAVTVPSPQSTERAMFAAGLQLSESEVWVRFTEVNFAQPVATSTVTQVPVGASVSAMTIAVASASLVWPAASLSVTWGT